MTEEAVSRRPGEGDDGCSVTRDGTAPEGGSSGRGKGTVTLHRGGHSIGAVAFGSLSIRGGDGAIIGGRDGSVNVAVGEAIGRRKGRRASSLPTLRGGQVWRKRASSGDCVSSRIWGKESLQGTDSRSGQRALDLLYPTKGVGNLGKTNSFHSYWHWLAYCNKILNASHQPSSI